jgi:hypothetical protein
MPAWATVSFSLLPSGIANGLTLLTLFLAGCSGSVIVESEFPPPLVERTDLKVALYYSPEFADYVYSEDPGTDMAWTVRLGAANIRMFDSLFGALFAATQRVSSIATAREEYPELDAILAPAVDALEFSLPSQSRTEQYAVWIRYNLDVYTSDGQLLVRWPVSAYGQSDAGVLDGEEPMERATVLAMRDAEATIAVEFARQPKIKSELLREPADEKP